MLGIPFSLPCSELSRALFLVLKFLPFNPFRWSSALFPPIPICLVVGYWFIYQIRLSCWAIDRLEL